MLTNRNILLIFCKRASIASPPYSVTIIQSVVETDVFSTIFFGSDGLVRVSTL